MAGLKINLDIPTTQNQYLIDGFQHKRQGTFTSNLVDAYAYRYDPLVESVNESLQFGEDEFDPSFDLTKAITDAGMSAEFLNAFGSDLAASKNQEHFNFIRRRINENLDRKSRLANTSWYYPSQLIAGIVDPLNIAFAIPFFGASALTRIGGLAMGRATVKDAAVSSLKGSLAVSAVSEGLRHPFDRTGTPEELATNLVLGTVLGTGLGTTPALFRAGKRSFEITGKKVAEQKVNRGFGEEILIDPRNESSGKLGVVEVVDPNAPAIKIDMRSKKISINFPKLSEEYQAGQWKEQFGDRAFDTELEFINFRIAQEQARRTIKRQPGQSKDNYDRTLMREAFDISLRGYNFKDGSGANSLFYKFLTTPTRRIMTHPKVPNSVKRDVAKFTADGALAFEGNKAGGGVAVQSMEAAQVKYNRQVDNLMRKLMKIYSNDQQTTSYTPLANLRARAERIRFRNTEDNEARLTFDEWFETYSKKFMDSKNPLNTGKILSETEEAVFELLEAYFAAMDKRAQDIGLFVTPEKAKELIKVEELKIKDAEEQIADLERPKLKQGMTGKQVQFRRGLQAQILRSRDKIEWYEGVVKTGRTRENFAFPMYYDKAKINQNKESFIKIIATHFRETPRTLFWSDTKNKWVQGLSREEADLRIKENKQLGIDEKIGEDFFILDAQKDAEMFVAKLLSEEDISLNFDKSPGAVGNKHLLNRKLDIPENLVKDYLKVAPEVMYKYGELMGRKIEYQRLFGDERLEDILARHERDMRAVGMVDDEIARVKADFLIDYERVLRLQIKDPTRWDTALAQNLKSATNTSLLGSAGLSAIADSGFIVLGHGLGRINNMFSPLNFSANQLKQLGLSLKQAEAVSEMALLSMSQAKRRFVNDSIQPQDPKGITKTMNWLQDIYFNVPIIGNNLGLVTKYIKIFDSSVRASHIAEYAIKAKNGQLLDFELEWAQRHGLTLDDLIAISKAPWQRGNRDGADITHKDGDWYLLNMEQWDVSTLEGRTLISKVDTAMDIGSRNTVFMASTQDKPAMMDGAIYFKHRPWMNAVGLRPDTSSRGKLLKTGNTEMVRFESGQMTIPFNLLSWTLGATTRFPMALIDSNRQHRIAGTLALMGMSYFVLGLKKPDWWFDSKDSAEIMQRVIDHSGLLGIYGDLYYNAIHALEGFGYIDEDTPFIYGKYTPESGIDAISGFAGAPVGYAKDVAGAAKDFLTGDFDEALDGMKRNTPFLSNRPRGMLGYPYSLLYSIADDMDELNIFEGDRRF